MSVIGYARFLDFPAFIEWAENSGHEWVHQNWEHMLYYLQSKISGVSSMVDEYKPSNLNSFVCRIKKLQEYTQKNDMGFDLNYKDENVCIISFGAERNKFVIPIKFLKTEPLKDYSELKVSEIRALGGETSTGSALIPLSEKSQKDIETEISAAKDGVSSLDEYGERIKSGLVAELEELQQEVNRKMAELEAKKQAMLEELDRKKRIAEEQIEQLNKQVFLLETEIYGIRCFLGETIKFIKLRSGLNAPKDQPVVLMQKLRYLDEELGRMVSLYEVDNKYTEIETLLGHCDSAIEHFIPLTKSVALVRVSKTGRTLSGSQFNNILNEYEMIHGNKIGILVRNGDNLYMGWADESKINIQEDMFYTPKTIVEQEPYRDKFDSQEPKTSTKDEVASRYFIFSILQGLLEHKNIIELPCKANFMKPSEYIVYSSADNWLEDNRFPTLGERVKENGDISRVGDNIVVIMNLSDMRYGRTSSFNDRNRSYIDRTHDCFVPSGLSKINLIEGHDIYVSAKKQYSDAGATANFRIESDEFINLEFFDSVQALFYINTKKIGKLYVGSQKASFAYMIPYLNLALEYCRERERQEEGLISAYYPDIKDVYEWPLILSKWKKDKGVRKITDYQARRFARHLTAEQHGS